MNPSPQRNMQRPLSGKLGTCVLEGDRIQPCGYHRDRAHSVPFGLTEDVLVVQPGAATGFLVPGRDMKALADIFRAGPAPTGSWYLVREQREWLEERLLEILSSRRGHETVRILEAGAASYIHHYTYLAILRSVLGRLPDPPRIALVAVDKCLYPILQIVAMERELAAGTHRPRTIRVAGQAIHIDRRFFKIMSPQLRDFGRISTELWVRNLERQEDIVPLGRFDVITEHFLTAVMDQELEQITRVRTVYSRVLAPGGFLLCATGINRSSASYQGYEELHPELGLRRIDEKTQDVWDPFDFADNELLQFSLGKHASRVPCALDNSMAVYRRE
jgi:hypothetical protein